MLIDLHTHTYPCSPCSRMTAGELLDEARRHDLDAVCVTDHRYVKGAYEAQALALARYNWAIFRGVEARTTLGDVLVFGLDEDFPERFGRGDPCRTYPPSPPLVTERPLLAAKKKPGFSAETGFLN